MKDKILAYLVTILQAFAGFKTTNAALKATIEEQKATIAERDKTIEDLLTAVEDDKVDDAALEKIAADARQAQEDAEAKAADAKTALDTLLAEAKEVEDKAAAVAAEVTADTTVPVEVNPDTGEVTNPA